MKDEASLLGRPQRRGFNKLSARRVSTIDKAGRHSDGHGLYLVVDASGARRWVFLFRWRTPGQLGAGRLREMGLGSTAAVSLARAREKAAEARALLADRIDPIAARHVLVAIPTFGCLADEVVEIRSEGLRSEKSKLRWKRALERYAAPLRAMNVDAVQTGDILKILKPIWSTKAETAQKVRGCLEAVLDVAKVKGYRSGDNPARWRGHLDQLLAKPQKLSRGHHAALPYIDLPDFVRKLHERDGMAALAMEFLILTAARSGEVMGATWSEIDREKKVWTVPANRMKAGAEHRVPLSSRALQILGDRWALRTGDHIFPGNRVGLNGATTRLSGMAFEMLLRRLGSEVTTHGFRSTFRDWAGEESLYPREIAEAALAHTVGDTAERAYRRGDALEKRRALMDSWCAFVEGRLVDDTVVWLGQRSNQ